MEGHMPGNVNFKLGTFSGASGEPYAGLVLEDSVVDLKKLLTRVRPSKSPAAVTVRSLLDDWDANFESLQQAANQLAGDGLHHPDWREAVARLASLHVLPPVDPPGQLFQAAANYRSHVIQLVVAQRVGAQQGTTDEELRARAERELDERARTGVPFVFLGLPSSMCGAYDDVILPRESIEARTLVFFAPEAKAKL